MNCPQCNVLLVMSERSGVEIDYCPQCRGVWLDKGELDKIIERANQFGSGPAEPRQAPQSAPHEKYFPKHEQHGHHEDKYGKHGKKKSWLGDIFDL